MGTIQIDHTDSQATCSVTADRFYSGIVQGSTYALSAESPPVVSVVARSSRIASVEGPSPHVVLASSVVKNVVLWAPNKESRIGMDGVAEISIDQGQRVGMYAYVETRAGAAITQATVSSVRGRVFRPSIEGGTEVELVMPTVAASVYDTVQYSHPDPDGYNLAVEFELVVNTASGGSTYVLEVIVELTTGEKVTVRGRSHVAPVLSEPVNAY